MKPAPPTIEEGLSVCSTLIRLRDQMRGARVEVFVEGNPNPIVEADANWPDEWFQFKPGTVLHPGDIVRARQRVGTVFSDLSSDAVSVQDRSTTTPAFAAPLVACAEIAVLDELAPGAMGHVRDGGGTPLGQDRSPGSRLVVKLSRAVGNGEVLHANSDACGAPPGQDAHSLPAEPMRGQDPKLQTPTLDDAFECQRMLHFLNTRPGATLMLERGDGSILTWLCSAKELHGRIDPLIKDEKLTFWLEPPSRICQAEPSDKGSKMVVGGPPPPPTIESSPCPGSKRIALGNLKLTATVKVTAGTDEICVFEASEKVRDVDLGNAVLVPGQLITAVQGLCGLFSVPSLVPGSVTKAAPGAAPHFPERLFECALAVRVSGLAAASRVSIYSDRLKGRIGYAFTDGETVDIRVKPPLLAEDRIYAYVEGCAPGGAGRETERHGNLPPFIVDQPIAGDVSVRVRQLLPGCKLDVLVDGFWAGGAWPAGPEVRVGVQKPLRTRQTVVVFARLCDQVRQSPPVTVNADQSISWFRPTSLAIENPGPNYMSGRVQAVLPHPTGILAGTEEGGLWIVAPGGPAIPLSMDWPNPLIRSLAQGTRGPKHVYCGTTDGLMENDPTNLVPLLAWKRVNGVPQTAPSALGPGATVNDILVLAAKNLIFIATNSGVWWSPIPATPAVGYVWSSHPLVNRSAFLSLCEGPGESVVGYGSRSTAGTMIFARGAWSGAKMQWTNTTPGAGGSVVTDARLTTVVARMAYCALASCAANRDRITAALGEVEPKNEYGSWLAVLRSDDGGNSWFIPYTDPNLDYLKTGPGAMGYQASRNLRVLIHPLHKNRILLAGRRTGLLGSTNGGVTWDTAGWPPVLDGTFYADSLSITLDPADPTGDTVIVGSDGGLFVSKDFGKTWDNSYNRTLTTLMFIQRDWSASPGLSASEAFPGLMVGAFQDQGKAYLSADGEPWRELGRVGDGLRALFVTGDVVLNGGNEDVDIQWSRWDGTKFVDTVTLEPPNYPAKTQFMPYLSRVPYPTYTDPVGGARMVALAGDNDPSNAFGLFDRGGGHSPVNERFYWNLLGTVPFGITSVGSFTGRWILVGTLGVHIYRLDPTTGVAIEMLLPAGLRKKDTAIRWLTVASSTVAFALVENTPLCTTDMLSWAAIPAPADTSCNVIAIDRGLDPARLFLAGSDGAWTSRDFGANWHPTSGLPRHPQANHLEIVEYNSGGRVANLGTWNWSAWRANLA